MFYTLLTILYDGLKESTQNPIDNDDLLEEMTWEQYAMNSFVAVLCVLTGGLVSGLTVGVMGIDEIDLLLKLEVGKEDEKQQARQLIPLINQHHLVLVTLLLANAIAMEALPLVLDEMFDKIISVLLSIVFCVIFGEIIPQAFCTGPDQIKIACRMVPVIKILIILLFPLGYPISKFLDLIFGNDHSAHKLNNEDIKTLIALHQSEPESPAKEGHGLAPSQIRMIHGAIDLYKKIVKDYMIPLEKAYCVSNDLMLSRKAVKGIMKQGYSRIPIFKAENNHEIIGILLTKKLLCADNQKTIADEPYLMKQPIKVRINDTMMDLLGLFLAGKSHMAIVMDGVVPAGLITLEDVMEAILKEEILDEEDHDEIIKVVAEAFVKSREKRGNLLQKVVKGRRRSFSKVHLRIKSL
ncbi:unnamed protein product [Blepharisma stoltei]|uniref:CNNM transmembrane domain-containing protein n=1 Tax=Blepharisma stoltei TaxID=1481888 RepID=A0AAU9JDJ1_9CILI|nr:unnamed protein product [Blepharisma stoltei]